MTQVQRTLAYLRSVEPGGATNADLARHLGTSHQTVYMLTQDLLRQGLIRGESQGRTWRFHSLQAPPAPTHAQGAAVAQSDQSATPAETNYPHVARWVRDCGWIEIGQDDFSRSMVRALDIGGLIWEGKASYATLDAALQDLDQALQAWFKAEMRE